MHNGWRLGERARACIVIVQRVILLPRSGFLIFTLEIEGGRGLGKRTGSSDVGTGVNSQRLKASSAVNTQKVVKVA